MTEEEIKQLHDCCLRIVHKALRFAELLRVKLDRAFDGTGRKPKMPVRFILKEVGKIETPSINLERTFNFLASKEQHFVWPGNPMVSAHEFVMRNLSGHLANAVYRSDSLTNFGKEINSSKLIEHLHAEYRLMMGSVRTAEPVESDYTEPISKGDLAQLLGVMPVTISRQIKTGELKAFPGTSTRAKKVRIHIDSLPQGLIRLHERRQKLSELKRKSTGSRQ